MPLFAAIGPILGAVGGAAGATAGALGGASGIAGLAGLGSSIYGAVNSANAVNASTKAQQQAYQQAEADLAPYQSAGATALPQLMALLGLGNGQPGNFGQPNYAAYVQNNPDVLAAFNAGDGKGATMDQFGQWHWNTFGQAEANSGNPNRVYTPYGPAGASGAGSQTAAFDALKNSPVYQSLFHNGEQTVLADAAATGGLRGGNAERSLYNLGTDTLAKVVQQQIANLSGLSSLGENAAAKVGNNQIAGGQVAGGGITSAANADNNLAKTIASGISNPQLLQALGLSSGISPAATNLATSVPTFPGFGAQTFNPGSLSVQGIAF